MVPSRKVTFSFFLILIYAFIFISTSLAAPIPGTKRPLSHGGGNNSAPPHKKAKTSSSTFPSASAVAPALSSHVPQGRLHRNDKVGAGQNPNPNTSFQSLPSHQIYSHPDGKGGTVQYTGDQINKASTEYLDILSKDPGGQDKTRPYPKSGSGWREGDQDPSNPAPKSSGQTAYHYPVGAKPKDPPGQSRVVAHGHPGQQLQLTPSSHDPAKPPNTSAHTGNGSAPKHKGFTPMSLEKILEGPLTIDGSMRRRVVF